MTITTPPVEQRVILGNVSWSTYLALLDDAQDPRGRMAYDLGLCLKPQQATSRH